MYLRDRILLLPSGWSSARHARDIFRDDLGSADGRRPAEV
jgi:hypothetical protein